MSAADEWPSRLDTIPIEHAELPDLTTALDDLMDALLSSGLDAEQVDEVRGLLHRSTEQLQRKPSGEVVAQPGDPDHVVDQSDMR